MYNIDTMKNSTGVVYEFLNENRHGIILFCIAVFYSNNHFFHENSFMMY